MIDKEVGAVMCSKYFDKKNGDGLAAVQWLRDCTFPEAVRLVAEYVGIAPIQSGNGAPTIDPIEAVARRKGCTVEGLTAYGAEAVGRDVVFPMFDGFGEQCSTFTLKTDGGKGTV